MTLVADGDLRSIDPRDLMRRAATTQGDCILTVAAGPGYRLALRDGRLLFACRGRVALDVERYLRRFEVLTTEEIGSLARQSQGAGSPLLLTALRNGSLEHPAAFARSFIADTIFDFVQEPAGAFVASPPVRPLPADLPVELEIDALLEEVDRRLDEEREAGSSHPSPRARITWRGSASSPHGAPGEHAGRIRSALSSGPQTVRDLALKIPAETHTLRIALAHMSRLGLVDIERTPESEPWPSAESLNGNTFSTSPKELDRDDRILLSSAEAKVLDDLASNDSTADDLARGFVRPSIARGTLAYLLRLGAVTPTRRSALPARILSLTSHPRFGPAALGLATLLVLALAWARFRDREVSPVTQTPQAADAQRNDEEAVGAVAQGFVAMIEGDLAGAKRRVREALILDPDNRHLAQLVERIDEAEREDLRRGREEAEAEREQVRQADRLIGRAMQALEAGDPPAAANHLAEASRLDPANEEVHGLILRTLRAARRPAATQPERRAAVQESSSRPQTESTRPTGGTTPEPTSEEASGDPVEATSADSIEPRSDSAEPVATAQLLVNAVPWGTVFIDGREVGITPLRLDLPIGDHQVEIRRPGFIPAVRTVSLPAGEQHVEAFVLTADIGQKEEDLEE